MTDDVTQERIRKVLAGVLEPLAKTLLRCGVGYTEFASLAKHAFVAAASADYGVRNRPTNIARVSVMTGLSRKEVSRIRKDIRNKASWRQVNVTIPAAVLEAWHTNPRYVERNGTPKLLKFSGSTGSFSSLVRGIARDIPPGAMRRELLRAGAIRSVNRAFLLPVKRHFIPDSAGEKLLVGLELGLRRIAETIEFNSNTESRGPVRFQRFIEGPAIRKADLEAVREGLNPLLARFSLAIDDYLSTSTAALRHRRSAIRRTVNLGVGIYYFDNTSN